MKNCVSRILSALFVLILLVNQLPAAAIAEAADAVDWDEYVLSHPEEFMTPEAEELEERFNALLNMPKAVAYSRMRCTVDSEPRYIVLAIDNSGSMSGTPMAATKLAARRFCEQALESTDNTYISIVTYSDSSQTVIGFSKDLSRLTQAISGLRLGNMTSHCAGLQQADRLLSGITVPNARKSIVLMSDGLPNRGATSYSGPYYSWDYGSYGYANGTYDYAKKLHSKYAIYTLGFFHSLYGSNLSFGRRFMKDIANGGYWEVTDPDDLEFTFGDIADTIISSKTGTFRYAGYLNGKHDSEATYFYSDDYFSTESTSGVNPHLATMSLCLELSTWPSYDVDADDWPSRTKNVQALFEEIGYGHFAQNEDWSYKPTENDRHTIGAVAAYKNIGNTTVIALVIRGGNYYGEWGSNFVLGSSGNHLGFDSAKKRALEFLSGYIKQNRYNEGDGFKENIKLWTVGFSRGGAVANMVAGELTDGNACGGVVFKPGNIYAYTFEAPQGYTGNSYGYANIHNYINLYDLVPLVAPSVWQFHRYNRRDEPLFAGGLGTKEYGELVDRMMVQYRKLYAGVPDTPERKDSSYLLEPFAYKVDIDVDVDAQWKWVWGPFGYPEIDVDVQLIAPDKTLPTEKMLTGTIDSVFKGIINGRTGYVNTIENPLSQLIGFFMGYNNKIDWNRVFEAAFFDNACEGIRKTAAPFLNPFNPRTLSGKARQAAEIAAECICDAALRQANTNLSEVKTALVNLLAAVLYTVVDDNDPDEFFVFLYYVISTKFQCHWPEMTLAWMMSQDSYYTNGEEFRKQYPEAYRVIHINCPVDVTVYDERGNVFASLRGDTISNQSRYHGISITADGTKQVILPSDAAYRIRIEPTGTGTMDISILEYNMVDASYNFLQGYRQLPLETGRAYEATIPAFATADYTDEDSNGSSTAYTLKGPDSAIVQPSSVLRGSSIRTARVSVSANNDKGIASGGGDYILTSYAQVEAQCLPTAEFTGWYQDGQLVSTEPVYRFAVERDTSLVAHFTGGDFHTLRVTSTGGGTVSEGSADVPAGAVILLSAEADPEYEFVRWETTAGSFRRAENPEAEFTMPSQDATVTAVFRSLHDDLPQTGDSSSLGGWLMLLCLSGILCVMLRRRFV